jgi:hypothetical protein
MSICYNKKVNICFNKFSLLLLFYATTGHCHVEDLTFPFTEKMILGTTRQAILKVPEVKNSLTREGKKIARMLDIEKDAYPFILGSLSLVQGRVTTKYLKGLRYLDEPTGIRIVPLLEYWIRGRESRAELNLTYNF